MAEMRTITFYSYKGGTGRTLALANVARQLARFGQTVTVVDFDLEAPGLHYKFPVGTAQEPPEIEHGVVDYIHEFRTTGRVPESILPFSKNVVENTEQGGRVDLIAAGPVLRDEYWRKLSQIHWRELLFEPAEAPRGPLAFLEFKEQIRDELKPDFLLIDSRTGVTEIGGVATGTLADQVMCFLINNRENLDGSRMVMRSFRQALRPPGMDRLVVDVALSRVPHDIEGDGNAALLDHVRAFLNEDADVLENTLAIDEILVLHSEPSLLTNERLLLAGQEGPGSLPLYADYQRLFRRIVPNAIVAANVGDLVASAWRNVADDPDRTQRELDEIAGFGHADAYRELIKFHRLRRASPNALARVAYGLWRATSDGAEALLWTVVEPLLTPTTEREGWHDGIPPEFAEDVWLKAADVWLKDGAIGVDAGLALARWYRDVRDRESAARVLRTLVDAGHTQPHVVARCIDAYVDAGQPAVAEDLVRAYAENPGGDPALLMAWSRYALAVNDMDAVVEIASRLPDMLGEGIPSPEEIEFGNRVVKEAGVKEPGLEEAWLAALRERLPALAARREVGGARLGEYADVYSQAGLLDPFKEAFDRFPDGYVEDALERARRRPTPTGPNRAYRSRTRD